ncbi:uncharacterized protein F5147DRAFT_656323 [Suillus discolor]|uniref:Uncharacterized protein n=1 Tax=Suillus discolor TaxID=1912936 RepID=A0A9P7JQ03_9AGAM|nr:uncharacterized protein F5147DRAFT_656323 [Suillus discolor]KAG2097516.1 hypothetical protein F5147DRAFT_656323 [Suillus discolor]
MLYHIVFRTTTTSRIRLTIADLEPAIFRHAPNPPADTLALAGSCCYQALLARLISMWGIANVMPDYPTAVQVHAELHETAMMLFQAEDDPDIVPFKAELKKLCTITPIGPECCCAIGTTPQPLRAHFLGTDQTETALTSWLQQQGCDTLSDPLFVTASVLFGWVNSHDLMALLDMSLKEGVMQMLLQQEEERNWPKEAARSERYRTWVDPVTYRAYMSTTFAENKPQHIDNSDGFTPKENKTPDVLKSDIHILGLKKQQAQAEVNMFSKALAWVAEFEGTDDGTCSGSTVTFSSLPSDTLADDWLDDCFSTSYTSSNASVLL